MRPTPPPGATPHATTPAPAARAGGSRTATGRWCRGFGRFSGVSGCVLTDGLHPDFDRPGPPLRNSQRNNPCPCGSGKRFKSCN
ncbi:SEC-C metal-binding domain-containing protein [Paracoccus solventivorans]|uniref:SEC-C metal-binding domain-containing protein n=1 Tax=Paracoccus solventivorans TaxID=53463 RepID=UPI0032C239A0